MWKHKDKEGVTHMTSDREILTKTCNDLSRENDSLASENAKNVNIAHERREIIKGLETDITALKDQNSLLRQEADALKIMLDSKSIFRTIRDKFSKIKFQSPIVSK